MKMFGVDSAPRARDLERVRRLAAQAHLAEICDGPWDEEEEPEFDDPDEAYQADDWGEDENWYGPEYQEGDS